MPPKGRNKHPLGIWYIFGTERTRLIELLDFADFASVNILKNILNAVRNFRSADVLHWRVLPHWPFASLNPVGTFRMLDVKCLFKIFPYFLDTFTFGGQRKCLTDNLFKERCNFGTFVILSNSFKIRIICVIIICRTV